MSGIGGGQPLALLDQGGAIYNVKAPAYGAKGDLRGVSDCSITSGSPIVASATAACKPLPPP